MEKIIEAAKMLAAGKWNAELARRITSRVHDNLSDCIDAIETVAFYDAFDSDAAYFNALRKAAKNVSDAVETTIAVATILHAPHPRA